MSAFAHYIEALFAPVFELFGDVPPRYLSRMFAPF